MLTGFRRMPLFASATDPEVVRAWLEPAKAGEPREASNHMPSAAEAIAKIGRDVDWCQVQDCDEGVAHLIALDVPDAGDRMQAIVARSYVRANAYANKLAERLEDRDFAKRGARDLAKVLAILDGDKSGAGGILVEVLGVIERHRVEPAIDDMVRRDGAREMIANLQSYRSVLAHVAGIDREAADAPLFFLITLGEAFALSTGLKLRFHDYTGKRESNAFIDLVRSALDITGLSSAIAVKSDDADLTAAPAEQIAKRERLSLDHILRRLGGTGAFASDPHRYRADAYFEDLAKRFKPDPDCRRVVVGELQSTGYELDFRSASDC